MSDPPKDGDRLKEIDDRLTVIEKMLAELLDLIRKEAGSFRLGH